MGSMSMKSCKYIPQKHPWRFYSSLCLFVFSQLFIGGKKRWVAAVGSSQVPLNVYKEYLLVKGCLYVHARSSATHRSPTVGAAWVSTDRWVGKQNVLSTYNRRRFSHQKEASSDACYPGDIMLSEISWRAQGQSLNGRTWLKHPEESEFTETESRAVTRDTEGEVERWRVGARSSSLGRWKKFWRWRRRALHKRECVWCHSLDT